MRWIRKSPAPRPLALWQARLQGHDPNYGYGLLRKDAAVVAAVVESLVAEQGWLDAYTGQRIEADGCHVEHVVAQRHCVYGQDVDYGNLVACYPPPNQGEAPYGAHQKRDWPAPAESRLFVSPLDAGCEARFRYDRKGEIRPATEGDAAAAETIRRLCLNEPGLKEQRRKAIQSELRNDGLALEDARKRLRTLEQQDQSGGRLDPYCFALKQALRKHIRRVEGIRASKAAAKKGAI